MASVLDARGNHLVKVETARRRNSDRDGHHPVLRGRQYGSKRRICVRTVSHCPAKDRDQSAGTVIVIRRRHSDRRRKLLIMTNGIRGVSLQQHRRQMRREPIWCPLRIKSPQPVGHSASQACRGGTGQAG
jgi:hypothetical protein